MTARQPNHRIALAGDAVTLHAAQATLPDPPPVGGDVSAWNRDGAGPEYVEITLKASAATDLTAVKLYSLEAGVAVLIADLNGGQSISLDVAKAFRQRIEHSPQATVYAVAATFAAANVTVEARPLRRLE